MQEQKNDPLHGKTLEVIVTYLVEHYGWDGLADKIRVNCFVMNPSIKSTLKFLRATPWARTKVENLYVWTISKANRKKKVIVPPDQTPDQES